MTASAFMSGATQTGRYAVTAPPRAGYGRRSVASSTEKAEAKRALETQLNIPNGAAEYEVHRSNGLAHKAALQTVVQNHRGLLETRFGRDVNALPTLHQTNSDESPNPLQRRFKQESRPPSNPTARQVNKQAYRRRMEAAGGATIGSPSSSARARTTFHQTNPGQSPNPLQRRFKPTGRSPNPPANASTKKAYRDRLRAAGINPDNFANRATSHATLSHADLLRARKEARAKYPKGHPERLKAERAVRQSRKAGGNAQAAAEYRRTRGGK